MCPVASVTLFTHLLIEAVIIALWLSKVQITQDKVMESVCTPEVTNGRTSVFWTTSFQCQTLRSAGLLGVRLKEFCCKNNKLETKG
jgi:hypothetical protein